LALDLDHFKEVNGTMGARGGNELPRQMAARLSADRSRVAERS